MAPDLLFLLVNCVDFIQEYLLHLDYHHLLQLTGDLVVDLLKESSVLLLLYHVDCFLSMFNLDVNHRY